ncbi:Cyclic AMP receptor, partial [Lachnellula suecica]
MVSLSPHQLWVLAAVERTATALSILGIATVFIAFGFSRDFRNPLHRIILMNAFFNVFDVVATMISLSGPEAGNGSGLCQLQGFLIQMFPLADVLWTTAMAINVFLIVFYRYEAADLRKLEIKYVGIITTLTFIPAFTFLFIKSPEKGPMYASVTLWCSVSPHYVLYRIIFFYGPVWLFFLITNILYVLVGIQILKQKRFLKSVTNSDDILDTNGHSPTVSLTHKVPTTIKP